MTGTKPRFHYLFHLLEWAKDRDLMKQERVAIKDLPAILRERIA